jgi:hypothetical protein
VRTTSIRPVNSELETLIAALPSGLLPAGRVVAARDGSGPAYWLSDEPGDGDLWIRLHAEHPGSRLWPLALHGLETDPDRPWVEGEVYPKDSSAPGSHDVEALLSEQWDENAEDPQDDDEDDEAERVIVIAPYSQWPGLAPEGDVQEAPALLAEAYAQKIFDGSARLGLVAAERGADVLATVGWNGTADNGTDAGQISAVLRSWEDRFGIRVVGVGFDTLKVSVAAAPLTLDEALPVAAEHFAFCPDNIWNGNDSIAAYAEEIVGEKHWTFWWD